ncbi:uncharacterized protein [Procambarus clarkii]|uniref:uncharacterized protein n=1 Tax=Procambarus clarkii TaxID=6728 RepID=UPI003743044F
MASLTKVLESIKAGQVIGLHVQVQKLLMLSSVENGEGPQIIRYCSRYVFENQNLEKDTFAAILDIVNVTCKYQSKQIASDPLFHLKSIFYIILTSTKRKDLNQYLVDLVTSMESYTNLCDASKDDALTIMRTLSQIVWNTSLNVSSPLEALTLQRAALQYLIAAGTNATKVCSQAIKAHLNYEQVQKSPEHLDKFYQVVICSLTEAAKTRKKCEEEEILAIFGLVMEYGKIVVKLNMCAQFSKITRPFVNFSENFCDAQTILALKFGLKINEVGMALKVGKCKEDMLVTLVGSCKAIPSISVLNTVILVSLLYTIGLFEYQQDKDTLYSLSSRVLSCLVEVLLERCNTPLTEDNTKKVTTVLYQQLGCFVDLMKTSADQNTIMTQALTWVIKTKAFMSTHCGNPSDALWNVYNVGVNTGNLGVLAFRNRKYDVVSKFLETSVDMLDKYHTLASQEQKILVGPSISKKVKLWSDALRYHGNYWEAGVAAARGFVRDYISLDDLITMWTKSKRDSEKSDNKSLKGLTVCDVVSEARQKYGEAEGITFNMAAALQAEISYYKKQTYDTVEDMLSCGRALECGSNAEMRVRGLLVITEALWIRSDLAVGDEKAIHCVNKAINILKEAMKGKSCHKLCELEAVAYFWLYLCHLQSIQDAAEAEVQEAEKPISLTTQATDLGEEEQVNDTCDVRPVAACQTLHAQEIFFAPLNTALKIWDKLSSQDVTLEDAEVACSCITSTAYVYQLSGLVTPTVWSWATLVSIASKHSLHTYLIKGISELLLIVPELVPIELVKEAEKALESCQEATPQGSSMAYLSVTTIASIAFYHLKMGQYEEGAKYLNRALETDVMEKRTMRAIEVQALVHFVASIYAWLPHWLLGSRAQSAEPCISYALLACREAIGLVGSVGSVTSSQYEVICWRHRVVWLHLTTCTWLGHLCVTSAQPRMARAYLKQSLGLAQRLAAPLRTAELLELLARVDLLCDQLEECQVKVDSLQSLLIVHPLHQPSLETMTTDLSQLTISSCKPDVKKTQLSCERMFDMVLDDEEKMRTGNTAIEYDLGYRPINPALVVVGPEERISQLANPKCRASPSMKYREEATITHFEACPRGTVKCLVCATPTVRQLHVATAVLLALVHSHGGYHQAAQKCLKKATDMFTDASDTASEVANHLISLLDKKSKRKKTASSIYVMSRLNLAHLQMLHTKAECLALDRKYRQALDVNLQALKIASLLEQKLLYQDIHFVTVLILQGYALQRSLEECTDTTESGDEVIEESPLAQEKKCKNDWKTPLKAQPKIKINSCLKPPRRQLAVPLLTEEKGFSIYSDDDMSEESVKLQKVTSPAESKQLHAKSIKKKVCKSHVKAKATGSSRKKVDEEIDITSHFKRLDLDDSPTRLVLKVPSSCPLSANKKIVDSVKAAKKLLDVPSSLSDKSQTKKKVLHKTKKSSVAKAIDFDEKDSSSNDSSKGSDDLEMGNGLENVAAPKQGQTARGIKDKKPVTAKPKKVAEARSTRASRSLRLV